MTKFTHPKDAKPGHKWTYEGHPVLEIYEGKDRLLAVYDNNGNPHPIKTDKKGDAGCFGLKVIDAPREYTIWINVYRVCPEGFDLLAHPTREDADREASDDRIDCFKHTFTEGEKL